MKIKDPKDPSKEIEVFTQAEVDAKIKTATDTATEAATKAANAARDEAIENYKKSNPDRSGEVTKLKEDLDKVTKELEQAQSYGGGGDRDKQIERLRKERDDAEAALKKEIGDLKGTIDGMQKSSFDQLKNELLDEYAGTDPEARKKVELEFDNYKKEDVTLKGMTERMEKAAQLAGVKVEEKPGAMDGAGGNAGARGDGNYGGKPTKVTENAKNIAKALGVTEEELAKQAEKNAQGQGGSSSGDSK